MENINLLYFERETKAALSLAKLTGYEPLLISRHDFPDGEFKLKMPSHISNHAVIFHSLDHPNDKIIELLFAARTARDLGVTQLSLVVPYLAYMRQDIAFVPGEVVSQRIVGGLIASLFDAVITVDPHLHRISTLAEAIPIEQAIVVSAAPVLGEFALEQRVNPFLLGPDGESAQWILQASLHRCLDFAVATKIRHGDLDVEITLPPMNVEGRAVVLLDDIASSGRTLARAAQLVLALGARTVDVAVTHALFSPDALDIIKSAGVENIWSTDTVLHPSNAVSVLPAIAKALKEIDFLKLSY